MKTYPQEQALAALISNSNSIAYTVLLEKSKSDSNLVENLEKIAVANAVKSDDLYPVNSLLVSSVWNKNDDVFTAEEIWKARSTPVNHPCNIDHDQTDIVGHMTDVIAIDGEGRKLDDDTKMEDLPALMHLVNSSVIYTHWRDIEQKMRIQDLIAKIEEGEMFVSMECIFDDFDYALKDHNHNNHYIVGRTEETAFLTKHLRIFGGEGSFNGQEIGRVLKNARFIGKGYTPKPANASSVIFDKTTDIPFGNGQYEIKKVTQASEDNSAADSQEDQNTNDIKSGVSSNESTSETGVETNVQSEKFLIMKEEIMKEQIEELKTELAQAKAESKRLSDELASADIAKAKADLDAVASELAEAKKFEGAVAELTQKVVDLESAKAELDSKLKEVEEAKAELELDFVMQSRAYDLTGIGYKPEDAVKTVETYANFNDEQWQGVFKLFAEAKSFTSPTKHGNNETVDGPNGKAMALVNRLHSMHKYSAASANEDTDALATEQAAANADVQLNAEAGDKSNDLYEALASAFSTGDNK